MDSNIILHLQNLFRDLQAENQELKKQIENLKSIINGSN